jgi:LPXTG-motif cell wall-anchored protein
MKWLVTAAAGLGLLIYGVLTPAYWCEDYATSVAARPVDGGCVAEVFGGRRTTAKHSTGARETYAPIGGVLLLIGVGGLVLASRRKD